METAISLYFHSGDPVAIHTLTAAAYNVIRDVNKAQGGTPMLLKDLPHVYVKEGQEKVFRDKVNEAENFFKHADRDPEATLKFNPSQTELLLLDVCLKYQHMTKTSPPLVLTFQMWYMLKHPDLFTLPPEVQAMLTQAHEEYRSLSPAQFLEEVYPAVSRVTEASKGSSGR
jgi:hypothetical protein